jgi:hypothetical protein
LFVHYLIENIKIKYTELQFCVVYERETFSVALREEHRLWVCENRVLRNISGGKRDEVRGEWRRLHKEKLYALYSSPSTIRVIKSRRIR